MMFIMMSADTTLSVVVVSGEWFAHSDSRFNVTTPKGNGVNSANNDLATLPETASSSFISNTEMHFNCTERPLG